MGHYTQQKEQIKNNRALLQYISLKKHLSSVVKGLNRLVSTAEDQAEPFTSLYPSWQSCMRPRFSLKQWSQGADRDLWAPLDKREEMKAVTGGSLCLR